MCRRKDDPLLKQKKTLPNTVIAFHQHECSDFSVVKKKDKETVERESVELEHIGTGYQHNCYGSIEDLNSNDDRFWSLHRKTCFKIEIRIFGFPILSLPQALPKVFSFSK
jgi:hypothetical protein